MPIVEKSIVINAPVEDVFALCEDGARVQEYMPMVVRNADIDRKPGGVGSSQRLTYSLLGLRFPGKVTVQEWEENRRFVGLLEGALQGTFTASFESVDGSTRVTWRLDYSLRASILNRAANHPLAERLNEMSVTGGLERLRILCEG